LKDYAKGWWLILNFLNITVLDILKTPGIPAVNSTMVYSCLQFPELPER